MSQITYIKIKNINGLWKLIKIEKDKYFVQFNKCELSIDKSNIEFIQKKNFNQCCQTSRGMDNKKFQSFLNFNRSLDLHGLRSYEVQDVLLPWIEDAHNLGIKQLKVIHGIGNGILRNTVITKIKNNKFIDSFINNDDNNYGVTIINLK